MHWQLLVWLIFEIGWGLLCSNSKAFSPGIYGERREGLPSRFSWTCLLGSFFCLIVFDNLRVWLTAGEISRIVVAFYWFFIAVMCLFSSLGSAARAAAFAYPHWQQNVQFFIVLRLAKGILFCLTNSWGFIDSDPSPDGIIQVLYMAGPCSNIQAHEKPECEPPMITILGRRFKLLNF